MEWPATERLRHLQDAFTKAADASRTRTRRYTEQDDVDGARPVRQGFTGQRWKAVEFAGGAPRETYPHLCEDCKQQAVTAQRQAERPHSEHREPGHQERDQASPEQKAGGWLSGFRS